jgi:hypothetical protein
MPVWKNLLFILLALATMASSSVPEFTPDFGLSGNATVQNYLVTTTPGSCSVTLAQADNFPAPAINYLMGGMPVEIGAAGASGAPLVTTIASIISATQFTVSTPCPASSLAATQRTVVIGYDDTAALQTAFSESAARPVKVPCGTYRVTGPLTVPAYGYVSAKISRPFYYAPGQATYGSAHNVPAPCVLLAGDTYSSAWSTAPAVITVGGWDHLEGIAIDISFNSSIPVIYGNNANVELVGDFTYGGSHGIFADYNPDAQDQLWTLIGNMISATGLSGIRFYYTSDSRLFFNWVHSIGNANGAIELVNSGSIQASMNVVEDNAGSGFQIEGSTQATIVGNKIADNYNEAIQIVGLTGWLAVNGNEFASNGHNGTGPIYQFLGTNTGPMTTAGNIYDTISTQPYMACLGSGATGPGVGSTFHEFWPSLMLGIYCDTATQAALQPMIANSPNNLPGPYANDAAAAAAGVPIGAEYYDASGVRRLRMS